MVRRSSLRTAGSSPSSALTSSMPRGSGARVGGRPALRRRGRAGRRRRRLAGGDDSDDARGQRVRQALRAQQAPQHLFLLGLGHAMAGQVAQVVLALFVLHLAGEHRHAIVAGPFDAGVEHRRGPDLVAAGGRFAPAVVAYHQARPVDAAGQQHARLHPGHLVLDAAGAGRLALEQTGGQGRDDGDNDQRADHCGAAFARQARVHGGPLMAVPGCGCSAARRRPRRGRA
ncbi:hypothetical protein [Achromobacter ruhlandii]|uniref:hypothetical protein n=1 Tax=Achromobacter ruhlandii TaxID=72557 RepID=UPI002FCE19C1